MLGVPHSEIETILVVGTCNIKEETAQWLDEQAREDIPNPELVVYRKDDYGWFISLPLNSTDFDDWKAVPHELGMVIMYAIGRGCHWLMIDQAAPSVKGLPIFEW